jgi:opacity protein-like surface antigen
MTTKHRTTWALGAAVAIALSVTHSASAQEPTRPDSVRRSRPAPRSTSSQRIKISKESPGEVAPPPDTIVPPAPPPPPAIVELPPPPPPPPPMAPFRAARVPGFFLGIGAGLAFGGNGASNQEVLLGVDCIPGQPGDPSFDNRRAAYAVSVPFGFQRLGSPLGVRFDVGYAQYRSHGSWLANDGTTGSYRTNPQIFTANADAKLRLFNITSRLAPYAIGGLSYGRFRNTFTRTGSDPIDMQDVSWHNSWGYNAGGGLEYMLGRTGLYVESRYFHLSGASGYNSVSHIPLIFGVTFY